MRETSLIAVHACCIRIFLFFFLQKSLKKEHFLWQLFHIEKDTEKLVGELEDEKRKLDGVVKEYEKCDSEETAKKKEQAGYLKQMSRSEGNIARKKIEFDKKVFSFCLHHLFTT